MPRRIGNTVAPRNPVARALANRGGGGAHQANRTSQRQQSRAAVQSDVDDWREDLAFERSLSIQNDTSSRSDNRDKDDSGNESSGRSFKKLLLSQIRTPKTKIENQQRDNGNHSAPHPIGSTQMMCYFRRV